MGRRGRTVSLELKDGGSASGRYDTIFGWYVVSGWQPRLGEKVVVDGSEREVVMVASLPEDTAAVHVLPDFRQAGCKDCGDLPVLPTPGWCRFKCQRARRSRSLAQRRARA